MVFVIYHLSTLEGQEKFKCAVLGPMPLTKAVCLYDSAGFTSYSIARFLFLCALLVSKALKKSDL